MDELYLPFDQEKWDAVRNCDQSYDGLFFYGVKTTGIFCRPSCRAKTPRSENVVFFTTADQAIAAGFRPCKICGPERAVFAPDLELVSKAEAILELEYNQSINLPSMAAQLGVSINHLSKLFKQHCGVTPGQYVINLRIQKSLQLLEKGELRIIEIAYAVGFKTLSNFYKSFKQQIGYTPKEYRKILEALKS